MAQLLQLLIDLRQAGVQLVVDDGDRGPQGVLDLRVVILRLQEAPLGVVPVPALLDEGLAFLDLVTAVKVGKKMRKYSRSSFTPTSTFSRSASPARCWL